MAIGTVTLDVLRSDLRARIYEIAPKKFSDKELERWLNVAQQELTIHIKDFSEEWYLASKTININVADVGNAKIDLSGTNYFSTDWAKVNELHFILARIYSYFSITSGSKKPVHIVPISKLEVEGQNFLYGRNKPLCSRVGTNLYFSQALSTDDSFDVFYYRKPVDMDTSNNLDIPDSMQDLVVMFAYNQCLRKLGLNTDKSNKDINMRLNEIRKAHGFDVQVDNRQDEANVLD